MVTGPGILNADMATLWRWTRGGWDWWREELRGMVPAGLRRLTHRAPAVVAHFDGLNLALTRRGAAIPRGRGQLAVALAVPASVVLVREVALPLLGTGDLRRLIAFDADRLLPFAAGAALVAHETGRAIGDGTQMVAIAGLRLETASAAMAAADAAGLAVRQLGVDAGGATRFDFLPAWRAAGAVATTPTGGRLWWGLAAAMAIVNLAVLIGQDVINLRETAALVAAHGETAAVARTLRVRVVAEDARRRALLEGRGANDPLPILAAITRALPDGAWTQRLAWDGEQVRLAGFRASGVDVVAALRRIPRFTAVRSTAVDIPAEGTSLQPFEATADTAAAGRTEGVP